jgi:hypothetical protein
VQDITDSTVPITVQPRARHRLRCVVHDLAAVHRLGRQGDDTFKHALHQARGPEDRAMLDYNIGLIMIKNARTSVVGTPGTAPSTITRHPERQVPLDCRTWACPRDGERYCALSPTANASVSPAWQRCSTTSQSLAQQYKTGVAQDRNSAWTS